MNFLLDTNVVSESTKAVPNERVVRWLAEADEDRVFISVVTLGELQFGIERLAQGSKRKRLEDWLQVDLRDRFEGRVLGIDEEIAFMWGKLIARANAGGRHVGAIAGFLAATAKVKKLKLVTRNVRDFAVEGVETVNPWSE